MSILPTLQCCISAIEEMNQKYPRSGFMLELGNKFDLNENYNELHARFNNTVGVYILFNDQQDIIRVGSSTSNLYSRLNTYFDYKDNTHSVGIGWWVEGVSARYVRTITVPSEQSFEALSIEKFLLDKLTPPLNKEGKLKHLAYRESLVPELDRLAEIYGCEKVSKTWWSKAKNA
ncbi:GIY-YIG nuclease family protein [Photobacterium angustum]|nr:GIY-YIG nuclease family protein [Photobacterium angustum]